MATTFVGLDCGWNVMNDHRIYGRDLECVVCGRADAPPAQRVTVADHINEGDDLFGEDVPFPEVAEGDVVAMVSLGGYCQSIWTDHCGRPGDGNGEPAPPPGTITVRRKEGGCLTLSCSGTTARRAPRRPSTRRSRSPTTSAMARSSSSTVTNLHPA